MWLCKRDACPHWAVSQCHHGPNLSLCAAHTAVALGPWAAARPLANICLGVFAERAKVFPPAAGVGLCESPAHARDGGRWADRPGKTGRCETLSLTHVVRSETFL